jgi:hypothetical protein
MKIKIFVLVLLSIFSISFVSCDNGKAFDVTKSSKPCDLGIGNWVTSANNLSAGRAFASLIVYNGYLYVTGGACTSAPFYYDNVVYAPIYSDGSIGPWTTSSNTFTNGRSNHTSVIYNGYLYIIGGYYNSGSDVYYNDIQYAKINLDGTIGVWTTNASPFPIARSDHSSAIWNNYVYVIGGNNAAVVNNIEYATINSSTHEITGWTAISNPFTSPGITDHTSIAYNNYLYVIGGYDNSSTYYSNIVYASIGSSGALGTFQNANLSGSFATTRRNHTSVVNNGYLNVIGGYDGTNPLNDVQYAPINGNGAIGAWNSMNSFTNARYGHTSVIYNGSIYVIGGYDGSGLYYQTTEYAKICE